MVICYPKHCSDDRVPSILHMTCGTVWDRAMWYARRSIADPRYVKYAS